MPETGPTRHSLGGSGSGLGISSPMGRRSSRTQPPPVAPPRPAPMSFFETDVFTPFNSEICPAVSCNFIEMKLVVFVFVIVIKNYE